MSLKHADIWRAIDRLAERNGFSPSGLARKAGLSSTIFNASKRISSSRKRWPSTESIASILRATNTSLNDFVALASPTDDVVRNVLPMTSLEAAQKSGAFDDDGAPSGKDWEEIGISMITDPHAFVLEITGKSAAPVYRDGDRIIVSPTEKPRRGDRVAMRKTSGEIMIGQLGRQTAQTVEITAFASAAPAAILPANEIEWMYRILWASQ